MEHQLGQWSSSQFKEAVNNKTTEMANPFQVKATKIQGKIFFFSYFFLQGQLPKIIMYYSVRSSYQKTPNWYLAKMISKVDGSSNLFVRIQFKKRSMHF